MGRQPRSVTGLYLERLGAPRVRALEDQISETILSAVRDRLGEALPVRIAPIVERFDILPKPRWDSEVRHGRLEFDSETERFVVILGGTRLTRQSAHATDEAISRRMRFTYAHEVAHRFFFVRLNGAWVRAVQVVTSGLTGLDRLRAERILRRLEENLCDRIAGNVLVPRDQLKVIFGETICEDNTASAETFLTKVKKAAESFAVSRECMLVQLKTALARGYLRTDQRFCAMLCGPSQSSGALRSTLRIRVKVPIVPSQLGEYRLVRKFSGIGMHAFGAEALRTCEGWLRDTSLGGKTRLPLLLRGVGPGGQERDLSVELAGWWRRFGHDGILLWGRLTRSGEAEDRGDATVAR